MRIGIDASRAFVREPTGTERYSYEVISRLVALPGARGHEWILYVRPNFQFSIPNFQSNSNVQIIKINLPYLWTQLGLAGQTWRDKLDVLWVPAHTLPVLRKPGLKTVVTIHGIEYEWLPAYENWLQRWYLPLSTKYAVRAADKIIAVSEFTKRQLIERLGAEEGRIEVVYEGESGNFQLSNTNFQIISKKFNLQKKKYILFVGTVQPRKNLERLIEAFSVLSTKYEGLRLVIAGKLGWNYDRVVELARQQGVTLTGYISDAERYILLQNAVVYVQPSITEGFGLPILEAWQAGVPVVSSSGGALAEIVGDAGLVFNPMQVGEMRKAIGEIIGNKKLKNSLIRRGRLRLGEFGWQKAALETYNILTSV